MPIRLDDPSLPSDLSPILTVLRAAHPREGCGVVLRGPAGHRVVAIPNAVAPELAKDAFAFDEDAWLRLLLDCERSGETVTCIFHAHVGAPAELSEQDRRAAMAGDVPRLPEVSYLVVSLTPSGPEEAALYRWTGVFFAEVGRSRAAE